MVTFYNQITDEEIDTMAEKVEEEQQAAVHDLQIKRKKAIESGASKDDEEVKAIDLQIELI
jgi:hypothetical protein|tara:strand:+ start:78 stop:260 length:183 start_codon:yes stop_codon:yes gene_type:complete